MALDLLLEAPAADARAGAEDVGGRGGPTMIEAALHARMLAAVAADYHARRAQASALWLLAIGVALFWLLVAMFWLYSERVQECGDLAAARRALRGGGVRAAGAPAAAWMRIARAPEALLPLARAPPARAAETYVDPVEAYLFQYPKVAAAVRHQAWLREQQQQSPAEAAHGGADAATAVGARR